MKMFTCGASRNLLIVLAHAFVTESSHAGHGAHHIEHGLQHCGPLAWRRPMKACTEDPFLNNQPDAGNMRDYAIADSTAYAPCSSSMTSKLWLLRSRS